MSAFEDRLVLLKAFVDAFATEFSIEQLVDKSVDCSDSARIDVGHEYRLQGWIVKRAYDYYRTIFAVVKLMIGRGGRGEGKFSIIGV